MDEHELLDILIEMTKIIYALSYDDTFSGGWKAHEIIGRLETMKSEIDMEETIDDD